MVFLKFNDATFSANTYPKLALVYPALKLPEMRGEFIRIWDDGRGVDSGRALLSTQGDAIRNFTGSNIRVMQAGNSSTPAGVFSGVSENTTSGVGNAGVQLYNVTFDPSKVVPTAAENRPRNIAFNFLVRAK